MGISTQFWVLCLNDKVRLRLLGLGPRCGRWPCSRKPSGVLHVYSVGVDWASRAGSSKCHGHDHNGTNLCSGPKWLKCTSHIQHPPLSSQQSTLLATYAYSPSSTCEHCISANPSRTYCFYWLLPKSYCGASRYYVVSPSLSDLPFASTYECNTTHLHAPLYTL